MPIRGARIGRRKWFSDVRSVILNHGFVSGAPGRMACPGFYHYYRAGFVIQILPANTISVTRPDGLQQRVSSRRASNVDSLLDVVVMEIEQEETRNVELHQQ